MKRTSVRRNSMSQNQVEKEGEWQVYETESNVNQIAVKLKSET